MRKKAVGMPFNWIFAIIAGGFILFLAIYAAGKFIKTSEQATYTQTAASLASLIDPLETGLVSGKSYMIPLNKKSKVFFDCDERKDPPFGRQTIAFTGQTFGNEYGETGGRVSLRNKHLFVEDVIEGKKMYFFSKPLFMPFKVTDITIIVSDSDKYCFYDSPEDIQESLEGLNLKSIVFVNETDECSGIDVCFDNRRCDISVDQASGLVRKNGKNLYYTGDWVYGAIFSSPKIYECNVKRVKARFNELAKIYLDKIPILERQGCRPQTGPALRSIIGDIGGSAELGNLYNQIDELDRLNRLALEGCELYYNQNWDR